jgi:hypothetical protein
MHSMLILSILINIANKARFQPQGAGATVGINTLAGAVTELTLVSAGTGYTVGDLGSQSKLNVSFASTTFVGVGTTGDPAFAGITSALGFISGIDTSGAGVVTSISLTYGGFGYTFNPEVTIARAGVGTDGVGVGSTATATAEVTFGEVISAFLNVPGEGYTTPPAISIASTTGVGVSITADVDSDGKVIRLNLINRGYGYSKSNEFGNNEENEVYIELPPLAKTEVAADVEIDRIPVGGGTSVSSYLAFAVPIPVGGVLEVLKQPAVLNPQDVLKIRGIDENGSGLDEAIDVCISYEETNDNYIGFGTATPNQ